ncbi:M14 family zinc carboxypeptidase [Luteimonas sp. e5]
MGLFLVALLLPSIAWSAPPSPREHFGFVIGDDYQLANYSRTEAYFRRLAKASPRVQLVDIGPTSEGRMQPMLVVSSPKNLARLEHYRDISARLARGREDAASARRLAAEGKAVVWIDGGLHSNETVGAHQLIETAWQLASREDEETRRILDDVIVLLVHANPDGHELYADWYMREPEPAKRVLDTPPRMYQKYAGHDNNRDFYMAALQETRNMNRVMYQQWYPQIVYNHHQSSPRGTVIVLPPYRDPFNYRIDAMIPVGLEALGAAMNLRYLGEGKPGAVSKRGSVYSTWWNGGLRTTPYFHNMLGILTEITGNPTPMPMPFLPSRQLPDSNLPAPVPAQTWHFRQSIDYSLSANWAVLDHASRHREQLLWNIHRMGRNSIERGQRDYWTPSPSALEAAVASARTAAPGDDGSQAIDEARLQQALHAPARRDPRGYILPADQADFATARKFVAALQSAGIEVHRAREAFSVAGKRYPAGSLVLRSDQAFRPHLLDMFEPQDHPHDVQYEGGPPIAPYDSAGWTLAFLMGVQFDRVLEAFDGPFDPLPLDPPLAAAPGKVPASRHGWRLDARVNDSYAVANRLLKAGVAVQRVAEDDGAFHVPADAGGALAQALQGSGVQPSAASAVPRAGIALRAPRIALWDRYGGSMVSGWTRLVLEDFGFDYEVVYPAAIREQDLGQRFDVLILPSGALSLPEALAVEGKAGRRMPQPDRARIPAQYHAMLGDLEDEAARAALLRFMQEGGHVIATGSSAGLALDVGAPLLSHLRTRDAQGGMRALNPREYYIPGSVLEVAVDKRQPVTWGLPTRLDVYFSDGRWDSVPVFDVPAGSPWRPILRFDTPEPLRSGWAIGQERLQGGVLAAQADVGQGRLTIFGTDITFRSQTHASFKLLFNSLFEVGHARAD